MTRDRGRADDAVATTTAVAAVRGPQRPERAHGDTQRSAQRAERAQPQQRPAAARRLHRAARRRRGRLRQPRAAEGVARQGDRRPRRGLRDRARLRRHAHARALRRHHQRGRRRARRPRSTPTCSTCCGSAPTSCSACACPTHAAVDETVALARKVNGAGARGLRQRRHAPGQRARPRRVAAPRSCPTGSRLASAGRRARRTPSGSSRRCAPPCSATARATAETVDAELTALLTADNAAAKVSLVARPGLVDRRRAACDAGVEPRRVSPIGAVLGGGDPGGIPAVRDGRAAVQDEGSQLVALALAAVRRRRPTAPSSWLDLCAGPGGKAGLLARRWPIEAAPTSPPTRSASTAPTWCARRCAAPSPGATQAGSQRHGAHRRRSDRRRGRARPLRPGARRRALHRAGGAAPSPRGALASQPLRRRRARQRCSASCWPPRWTPRRPAASSPTPRAARTSPRPVRRRRRASSAGTTSS